MSIQKKYHISPRTGDAMMCNAKFECPFTSADNHFDTPEEARAAFEDSRHKQLFPEFIKNRVNVSPLPKGLKKNDKTFIIPRGVYIIGDPFNILSEDPAAWRDWQNIVAETPNDHAVGACYNEHPVIGLEAMADSIFHDSMGRAYSCSSGYIGLVPISLAKQMNITDEAAQDDGYLLNFNEDTEVDWYNGNLCFGDRLFIKTEPDQDSDFDEDEELFDVDAEEVVSGAEAPDEEFYADTEQEPDYDPFAQFGIGPYSQNAEKAKGNSYDPDYNDDPFSRRY